MGLINNSVKNDQEELTKLNVDELEAVINALHTATCPVRNIESLYTAIAKLQEQHKQLQNAKN